MRLVRLPTKAAETTSFVRKRIYPMPRETFDIAYALEHAAPFRDDEECLRWLRYPEPPDRQDRIGVFCDGYGIAFPDNVVAFVATAQRSDLARCSALAGTGIEPQATWAKDGYLDTLRACIAWTEAPRL